MSHSLALAKAAETLLLNDPDFDLMEDNSMNGLAHYQYYATALMLVGYSLEVTLKNMIIINNGIDDYISNESKYMTHDLEKLAYFVPDLEIKDKSILNILTKFTILAGKYRDPGFNKGAVYDDISNAVERYKICAKDIFQLATKITKFALTISNNHLKLTDKNL